MVVDVVPVVAVVVVVGVVVPVVPVVPGSVQAQATPPPAASVAIDAAVAMALL
ncbi:MAG TPA: hypothetical protein VG223_14800 [Solirubrobacteraceae bacterium]|nr:hypothetical protein [Solirubrobacteraceae bacterium]